MGIEFRLTTLTQVGLELTDRIMAGSKCMPTHLVAALLLWNRLHRHLRVSDKDGIGGIGPDLSICTHNT